MSKNLKIVITIAFLVLLAGLTVIADYYLFPLSIEKDFDLSNLGNESGLYIVACDLRKNFYDLDGSTFVSEILRHFALFLFFASAIMPVFINYFGEPIERTELNLTNKLI
jgi:hypothetical protein